MGMQTQRTRRRKLLLVVNETVTDGQQLNKALLAFIVAVKHRNQIKLEDFSAKNVEKPIDNLHFYKILAQR